ncbi:MAG TPA: hypothetical protein VI997_05940 [Candidatus Thermoplasmatota archaeon]|nr:hypothetical protein [Candidatus Thermoplasmatota archaeon]
MGDILPLAPRGGPAREAAVDLDNALASLRTALILLRADGRDGLARDLDVLDGAANRLEAASAALLHAVRAAAAEEAPKRP